MVGNVEPTPQDVAARIRSARIARGVNQQELAKQAGLHRTVIARAEAGGFCRASTLRKIALALGTTLTCLRRPFLGEENYRLDRLEDTLWVASNPSFIRRKGIPTRNPLNDADERHRLGTLGLANAFVRVINNDLPGGRLHAVVVESYRKEQEPVAFPGQMFLYVLKGHIKFTIEDKSMEMGPGDTVSYWNDKPNLYETVDGLPATILEVFVDMSDEEIEVREIFDRVAK